MKTTKFNCRSTTTASGLTDAGGMSESGGRAQDPIRLWLVDDNDELRNAFAALLGTDDGIQCTHSFGSATAALSALASKAGPDVILLDINIGMENGLDAVRPIRSLSRSTRVLMLTTFFDSQAQSRALDDGASGFLLKHYPLERILDSIRQARFNPEPPVNRPRRSWVRSSAHLPDGIGLRSKSWRERLLGRWN